MQNKIRNFIYFICIAILSGFNMSANSECDYKITASLSEKQYNITNEIENIFKNHLYNYNSSIIYTQVPRGLVLSIDSSIFFEENDYEIKETSKELLNKIGEVIKYLDKPCLIEGNAKLSGIQNPDFPSNWEISTARAQKITEYLIIKHKLNPQKIQAIGFGEKIPNNLNQRMDFVIINYEEKN